MLLQSDVLRRFADKIDYLMQADEVALDEYLRSELFQNPKRPEGIVINDDKDVTPYSPYQFSKSPLLPSYSYCFSCCW